MFDIFILEATPYFAFGQEYKSSLISQFCRQNRYHHVKNPILEAVQNQFANSTIIEGTVKLFKQLEPLRPELKAIFIGTKFTDQEIQIRRDYRKIGKCVEVRQLNYQKLRKAMYPNLIFFYGPIHQQNLNCAHALANQIGYCEVALPPNANIFIKEFKKTVNYVVSGLFTDKAQISILQVYFNIKIIHLQYNRIDLPYRSQFFDKQFELLPFLKSKPYYYAINAFADDITVIDEVSESISPTLVYCQIDDNSKRQYLNQYVERNQENTIILSIFEIQSINKRKNIKLAETSFHRTNLLNQILYQDFAIKRALILDFPFYLNEILNFESANRKFECLVDLISYQNAFFFKQFTTPMYFLQNQKRIVPNIKKPLESYLNSSISYWLINGPVGSGKTTVAKYLVSEYGFKLIQYQLYLASIKQKLIAPEDGQELPLRKILAHFRTLLLQNSNDTYIIDGLSLDNKDLQEWIKVIGPPSVINLEVQQNEVIKRIRKKNQADLNAEINEQEISKAKQSQAKSQVWLQKVLNFCPTAQIHEINFNFALILSQKQIQKVFKKNVYLVQRHNSLTFQNIALRYNLALINLHMIPLRQTLNIVRKISNKNIILCFYHQQQQKLISQDLYWIQKNIGTVRYLGINQPEQTEVYQEKIKLIKPQAPNKPKAEGVEGEEKPSEDEPVEKKDIFDIYAYEWTQPTNPKNLSQWFLKSKKNPIKVQSSSTKQVFQKWSSIVEPISVSQELVVYHCFK